jgi:hypothetical protein
LAKLLNPSFKKYEEAALFDEIASDELAGGDHGNAGDEKLERNG